MLVSAEQRAVLERWARRPKTAQALALRARIVLRCAQGFSNGAVAAQLGVHAATVGKWRRRFVAEGLDGLLDEPRPGAPRQISDEQVEELAELDCAVAAVELVGDTAGSDIEGGKKAGGAVAEVVVGAAGWRAGQDR